MPPPDKRLGARIAIRPLTPLQKVMKSAEFDFFIIVVIIVNCIFMASESPVLEYTRYYIVVSNYVFNVIFILELALQILAFGVLPYFSDQWHYIDAVVVASALLDFTVAILKALEDRIKGTHFNFNVQVLRVLRVVRVFRVLRPLRSLRQFQGILVFVESLVMSIDILLITSGMFLTAMVAIAFLTNSFVGNTLLNRCQPPLTLINGKLDLFLNSTARSNPNYQAYGPDYFTSSYNMDICKDSSACNAGLYCLPLPVESFIGIPGDYSTPWSAFKTNLSFVTLRGWPLIFIAISKGHGMLYAFLVLFATALVCPLFILNMFPAIFIISLKRREETQRRLDWLAHFPGNKETVTELELFIWANNNQQIFFRLENAPSVNILTQMINACFRCCQYVGIASKTPPPKPTKKLEIAANTNNINAKQDDHMLLQNNGEDEEDTVFLGAEEDDPDFGKGKLCVPKCRSIAALRSLLTAESSPFSQFINIIIVLNILNLAADAASTPPLGRVVVQCLNYAFISIFMLEVVVKICILGPCLYLDSPFNLLDFTLVILSIPTFFDPSFQVLGVLRIFRLARLARSGQITRLYNQLNTAGAQKALKTPITLGRLSAMIFDLFTPMLNNVLMVVVLIYIYALVGMQFFAKFHADPYTLPEFSLKYQNPLSIPGNATAVEVAGIFSAGQYLSRMNFNCFGNAVVTVYNLGLLNGWYLFMINTVHRTQRQGVIWYFFSYVYIVVFLLGSALIASVASVLDGHAKAMIRDIAGSNKSIVDRYVILSRRERLRVWFKKLKKNTIESGVNTSLIVGKSKLKREAVAEYTGPPPVEPFLKKFMRERADYSLYLLSRQNIIRRGLKYLIESIFFQLIITFSILVSVIGLVVSEDRLMGPVNESLFLVVIFLSEMVLLWLVYGLIGSPNAYFNQPLYLIDFFVNAAMMYAYYTDFAVLNQLRLFRMLKVPSLMLYLTDSNTMRIFFVMIYNALPSLVSVLCMTLGTTFLTAVVGVQLYTGKFNHCSYQDYPGARSRFERDPVNFPTGCSGTGYTNVNTSVPFDPVTGYGLGSVLSGLHWQARLDNFDSIFTACKSTLRVLMSNEWQGILFSSLDIVGVNFEPSVNYQRSTGGGSFIFYFIISTLGITIGALYVSIFYYHIVITCILSGRKSLIGRQDAMWALYEEKLILVKRSLPVAKHTWAGLAQFYRRFEVKFIIIAYCVIPIVLLIGFYKDERYSDKTLTFYDTIFSILYVAEYMFRGMSDFTLKDGLAKLYKRTNKQEVGVVIFLIVCVLINVRTLSSGNKIIINTGKLRDIEFVCASAVVRVYRLAILFPNALLLLGVMQHSLGGFISLCIYGLIVIMIYGLLGFDVMHHMKPTYGSPFLNDALNFRSVTNSFFTLIAMGTGNYYSEVLDNMKQESKNSLGIQVFMEIYFLSFYLLFFLTLKSFAIQIIIRYESTFGSTIGIAGEQVTSFRHGWKSAGLFQNVKYEKLASLLGNHIPPPLGLAGTDPRYLELTRFVKKVLMCMPADSKRCLDGDKTGKLTRTMFKPENIPGDIRCIDDDWDPTKERFSFRQVIVAVHKRALFDTMLTDEVESKAARLTHQSRLDDMVIYLSRLTLARFELQALPFKALTLMQRLRPDMYKNHFVSIIRAQLHTLRLKIHVFGFAAFDAFVLTTLRDAVHLESKAAALQLDVKKKLESSSQYNRQAIEAHGKAKKFNSATKNLMRIVDELYDSKMKTVWDVDSIEVYATARERKAVSAVAIDFSGKIFVALNSGLLKIYKTREIPGLPLRLVQKIVTKAHIRSMVVSHDSKKIFLGCGNDVTILVLGNSRKRLNYKELLSFSGHSSAVNVVVPFDRFILSGGQDSFIYLWRLNSRDPANSYDAGSAVFCLCVVPVIEKNVAVDELTLTDVLVAGTQRGKLLVLPLPLAGTSTESAVWEGFYVDAGECGVSAVQVAWGYVYAGFTDGRVKTWAVEMRKSSSNTTSPIKMVNFLPVQSVQVHAGPVTCLSFAGGLLFSASYDFSILPWTAPDRLHAKTEANFSQNYREGLIFHGNSILSVASNKSLVVSGDEGGRVTVIYAKKAREDFMGSGPDTGKGKSTPLFNFSFIEYDFNKCFLDNNGGILEEEVMLNIVNLSGTSATIRCLLKRHPCFRVETCENENRNTGNEVVSLISHGSSHFKVATRFDNHATVQFRVVFHPFEARNVTLPVKFLINEKIMVTVLLRGNGCRSKICVSHNIKLYEMGTVVIGQYGVEKISIENKEDRPILVNCLAECEDKIEKNNHEIVTVKHNLASKSISVIPRCFSIPPHAHVDLLVRFNPVTKMDVFKLPIRAVYGGGEGTLAEIRVRAENPPINSIRESVTATPRKSSIVCTPQVVMTENPGTALRMKNRIFGSGNGTGGVTGDHSAVGSVVDDAGRVLNDARDILLGMGEEGSITTEDDLDSHLGAFDEAKAMQYLYRGLRTLSPSESPCPNDLVAAMLRDVGWRLAVEGPLTLLMNAETGIFIEIPDSHASSSSSTGNPEHLSTLSEFEIDFRCDEPSVYELWHGDRLIKQGQGQPDMLNQISVDSSDLFHETDRFGCAIPINIPEREKNDTDPVVKKYQSSTTGLQLIILHVFARSVAVKTGKKEIKAADKKPFYSNSRTQPDGRLLLHSTHIKLLKGFRLGFFDIEEGGDVRDRGDNDDQATLQLEERVMFCGIARVTTYLEHDLGTFTEFFEKDEENLAYPQGSRIHKKPVSLGGEPHENLFARSLLCVNTAVTVPPADFIPEKTKNDSNGSGINHHTSKHDNDSYQDEGPSHIRVLDRAVALDLQDPLESTVVEHRVDVTESGKTSNGIKEVFLERPVLSDDINIHRCNRDLTIQLLRKPENNTVDDMVKDEVLAATTVSGHAAVHLRSEGQLPPFQITRSILPHLIHSRRHGVYIRVRCPIEEPPARVKHLYALMNQVILEESTTEPQVSSIYTGQWYFLVDRNSLKLVSSTLMDAFESVDLTFLTRGFVAEFRGSAERCTAALEGRHVTSQDIEELPKSIKSVLSKLQLTNYRGMSSQFTDAPGFLRSKWGELVRISLHRKVINAMTLLVEKSRIVAAGRAAQEAAVITREYEAYVTSTGASAGTSNGKNLDSTKKKEMEMKIKRIMDATPNSVDLSSKDVYQDMTRITNEAILLNTSNNSNGNNDAVHEDSKTAAIKAEQQRLYAMSTVMTISNLSAYLIREVLPGFDEPLTGIQTSLVLESLERSPTSNSVKLEQFALWYKVDNEKQFRADLKSKRIFAYLLEEITQKEDNLNEDIEEKTIKGSNAKKIIKEMNIGVDSNKEWEIQEMELVSSTSFNEGMDYIQQGSSGGIERMPSVKPTTTGSGIGAFFRPPKFTDFNPQRKLSNFIQGISAGRNAKQKEKEKEKVKSNYSGNNKGGGGGKINMSNNVMGRSPPSSPNGLAGSNAMRPNGNGMISRDSPKKDIYDDTLNARTPQSHSPFSREPSMTNKEKNLPQVPQEVYYPMTTVGYKKDSIDGKGKDGLSKEKEGDKEGQGDKRGDRGGENVTEKDENDDDDSGDEYEEYYSEGGGDNEDEDDEESDDDSDDDSEEDDDSDDEDDSEDGSNNWEEDVSASDKKKKEEMGSMSPVHGAKAPTSEWSLL